MAISLNKLYRKEMQRRRLAADRSGARGSYIVTLDELYEREKYNKGISQRARQLVQTHLREQMSKAGKDILHDLQPRMRQVIGKYRR